MIITGIAHPPQKLRERSLLPSPELVYLAKLALNRYNATRLITSLAPGWEQALARAAKELDIPYTTAIPYPGRENGWARPERLAYLDLLAKSDNVNQVVESAGKVPESNVLEGHFWQADQAEIVLVLWDYEFGGETFEGMNYALLAGKRVINLWEDWRHLYSLRRQRNVITYETVRRGAQVFESKENPKRSPTGLNLA